MNGILTDKKTWMLIAMLAVIFGYILNQPSPPGFQEPYKLKVTITALRILNGFIIIAEKIGWYNSRINCTRALIDTLGSWTPLNTTGIKITDDVFNGVPVRLVDVLDRREPENGPAAIYFHGGGFSLSGRDAVTVLAVEAARKLRMPVLFVEYRLAPEYPYPIPLDDCENATKFFLNKAKDYNVNANRVAVIGDSSGGNLAACLSLKMRSNRAIPKFKLQVLLWPMLQAFDFNLPSYQNDLPGTLFSRRQMIEFWLQYMGKDPAIWPLLLDAYHVTPELRKDYGHLVDKRVVPKEIASEQPRRTVSGGNDNLASAMQNFVLHPHVCPLMLKHYVEVPHLFIYTLQYDLLRDEGIIYAKRLQKSGMKVTHRHWPNGYHAMLGLSTEEIQKLLNEVADYVIEYL